nr:MAG TPA: hypothetical protein [Caudoviricetes sp.]
MNDLLFKYNNPEGITGWFKVKYLYKKSCQIYLKKSNNTRIPSIKKLDPL